MNYMTGQFDVLQKHFPVRVIRPYKDGVGVHCFLCARGTNSQFLFVAKNSTLNGLVSIHKSIVELSAKQNLQFVMSVMGSFYKFYGSQVLVGKAFENEYNGARMVNFYLHTIKAEKIPLPGGTNDLTTVLPKGPEQLRLFMENAG